MRRRISRIGSKRIGSRCVCVRKREIEREGEGWRSFEAQDLENGVQKDWAQVYVREREGGADRDKVGERKGGGRDFMRCATRRRGLQRIGSRCACGSEEHCERERKRDSVRRRT